MNARSVQQLANRAGIPRSRAAVVLSELTRSAPRPKKVRRRAPGPSTLEREFSELVVLAQQRFPTIPAPVREYPGVAGRKFRFDFAWPVVRVAVELEGAVFTGGRHTRGSGFVKDCEKYNLAALSGWKVLRYTSVDLRKRPFTIIADVVQAVLGMRPAMPPDPAPAGKRRASK